MKKRFGRSLLHHSVVPTVDIGDNSPELESVESEIHRLWTRIKELEPKHQMVLKRRLVDVITRSIRRLDTRESIFGKPARRAGNASVKRQRRKKYEDDE